MGAGNFFLENFEQDIPGLVWPLARTPLDEEIIAGIVDDVFLPLVRQ